MNTPIAITLILCITITILVITQSITETIKYKISERYTDKRIRDGLYPETEDSNDEQ